MRRCLAFCVSVSARGGRRVLVRANASRCEVQVRIYLFRCVFVSVPISIGRVLSDSVLYVCIGTVAR